MKNKFLLVAVATLFSIILKAQQPENFLKTELTPGFPNEIESLMNQLGLSHVSYSLFETGIDTLDVKFGEFVRNGTKGYWISLFSNKIPLTWATVQLSLDEESGLLTNTVDIHFDNSSKKISVLVTHHPANQEISYQWIDKDGSSKVAAIQTIERRIQENKLMPYFSVKTLDGADVSLNDFKGKYLVLNWWATTCGPCIAEMPGLNELVEKYKLIKNVHFVAIAWDDKKKVETFLKSRHFKYQQTFGSKEIIPIFGESFPKHIIINPNGLVTYYSEGGSVDTHRDIERHLKARLNE